VESCCCWGWQWLLLLLLLLLLRAIADSLRTRLLRRPQPLLLLNCLCCRSGGLCF